MVVTAGGPSSGRRVLLIWLSKTAPSGCTYVAGLASPMKNVVGWLPRASMSNDVAFHRVLASAAVVGPFCVLLGRLLAPGFTHTLVYWLLRKRFPMTLSWRIDWSPTDPRGGSC